MEENFPFLSAFTHHFYAVNVYGVVCFFSLLDPLWSGNNCNANSAFQRAACVACENDVLPSNPINNATLIACRTWSLEHLSQLCPIGVSLVRLSTAPV